MSDVHPARLAIEQHAERWNAQDRERWLGLFADEIVFEDPVGKAPDHKRTNALLEACRDEGLLLGQGGMWGHCVRIGPSLLATEDEIAEGLEKLGKACVVVEG